MWAFYRDIWPAVERCGLAVTAAFGGEADAVSRVGRILATEQWVPHEPRSLAHVEPHARWVAEVDPSPSSRELLSFVRSGAWNPPPDGLPAGLEGLGPWVGKGLNLCLHGAARHPEGRLLEHLVERPACLDYDPVDPSPLAWSTGDGMAECWNNIALFARYGREEGPVPTRFDTLLARHALDRMVYDGGAHLDAATGLEADGEPRLAWNLLLSASFFGARYKRGAPVEIFRAGLALAERHAFPIAPVLAETWRIYIHGWGCRGLTPRSVLGEGLTIRIQDTIGSRRPPAHREARARPNPTPT